MLIPSGCRGLPRHPPPTAQPACAHRRSGVAAGGNNGTNRRVGGRHDPGKAGGEAREDAAATTAARRAAIILEAEALVRGSREGRIPTSALAASLGLSPRALHAAFVAMRGVAPATHLRNRRLDWAREALTGGGAGAAMAVKEAALRHGFCHLGRFSAAFRQRFGEAPSAALARARAAARLPHEAPGRQRDRRAGTSAGRRAAVDRREPPALPRGQGGCGAPA